MYTNKQIFKSFLEILFKTIREVQILLQNQMDIAFQLAETLK